MLLFILATTASSVDEQEGIWVHDGIGHVFIPTTSHAFQRAIPFRWKNGEPQYLFDYQVSRRKLAIWPIYDQDGHTNSPDTRLVELQSFESPTIRYKHSSRFMDGEENHVITFVLMQVAPSHSLYPHHPLAGIPVLTADDIEESYRIPDGRNDRDDVDRARYDARPERGWMTFEEASWMIQRRIDHWNLILSADQAQRVQLCRTGWAKLSDDLEHGAGATVLEILRAAHSAITTEMTGRYSHLNWRMAARNASEQKWGGAATAIDTTLGIRRA